MSLYLYDEAVVKYLQSYWDNNVINILPTDLAFENDARFKDSVTLPLITVNRLSPVTIENDISNYARTRLGATVVDSDSSELLFMIRSVAVSINYNIDVWTRTKKENDDIIRELVWLLIIKPRLSVVSPYGINEEWSFSLYLEPDIEDNSDIIEFANVGEYYRQTLTAYTSGAMLFLKNNKEQTNSIVTEYEGVLDE